MITSPHNDKLKEIRKLASAARASDGAFVAEGEDLLAAADAAGLAAPSALRGWQRLPASRSSRRCWRRSRRWARARARSASTRSAGRRAGRAAVRRAAGASATRATSATVLRSALAFGAASRRARPRLRRPVRPEGGARVDGRDLRACRSRASTTPSTSCPGTTVALVARDAASRWPAPLDGPVTLVVGAERDGPARRRRSPRATRVAHIPIATESLNAAMAATVALYELTH